MFTLYLLQVQSGKYQLHMHPDKILFGIDLGAHMGLSLAYVSVVCPPSSLTLTGLVSYLLG